MTGHREVRLALRAKLMTLSVCTTGATTLEATPDGYVRSSGSFITDGFAVGMEVKPAGFVQTTTGVITEITDTVMTISGGRLSEPAGNGRSLSVVLPSTRAWENIDFRPSAGVPFVEESYSPGTSRQVSLGETGVIETLPLYVVKVYVPAGTGVGATDAYADALLRLFAPRTSISVTGGTLEVRTNPAPFRGQALVSAPGFAVVPVNVPLRLRTNNLI